MGIARLLSRFSCLLLIAIAGLAGCGSDDDGGYDSSRDSTAGSSGVDGSSGGTSVSIEDFAYEPAGIAVPQGTKLTFTNHDSSPHTATSTEAGAFETGTIKEGKTDSVTLDEPGTFAYYCAFHPFMKGKLVVE